MSDERDSKKRAKKGVRSTSNTSRYKGNNEGGYGNPPVKGQFGPGNKGGPGRPRGPQGLAARMRKMLKGSVSDANGNTAAMETAFTQVVRREMLTGGTKGVRLGLDMFELFGDDPAAPEPSEQKEKNKPDLSLFTNLELDIYGSLAHIIRDKVPDENFEWRFLRPGLYEVHFDQRGIPRFTALEGDQLLLNKTRKKANE